jgi:hypothetical protein
MKNEATVIPDKRIQALNILFVVVRREGRINWPWMSSRTWPEGGFASGNLHGPVAFENEPNSFFAFGDCSHPGHWSRLSAVYQKKKKKR